MLCVRIRLVLTINEIVVQFIGWQLYNIERLLTCKPTANLFQSNTALILCLLTIRSLVLEKQSELHLCYEHTKYILCTVRALS